MLATSRRRHHLSFTKGLCVSYAQLQIFVAPETFIREQVWDCFSRFYYATILDGTTFLRVGFWTSLITCDISCPDLQWPMWFSHLSIYSWIWMNLQGEPYQKIIKNHHFQSQGIWYPTSDQGPENQCIVDVIFFGRGPNSPKAMWTSSTCIGLECLWQYHGWFKSLGESDFLCHFWW